MPQISGVKRGLEFLRGLKHFHDFEFLHLIINRAQPESSIMNPMILTLA
jgi:hypothetical protein